MGGGHMPPMQPLPPPAPEQLDPAILEARRRAKARAASTSGREGTILTGPSGLEGSQLGKSTLLGGSY